MRFFAQKLTIGHFGAVIFLIILSSGAFWQTQALAQWTPIAVPDPAVTQVVIDPQTSSTIYVVTSTSLYKSTDGGVTWNQLGTAPASILSLAINPTADLSLYAGTPTGFFVSSNGGTSWTESDTGLGTQSPPYVQSVVLSPSNPSTIYAGLRFAGVWISNDGGTTWTVSANGLPTGTNALLALTIDPTTNTILYAGFAQSGLYKSIDGGVTWTVTGNGLAANQSVNIITVNPTASNNIFAYVEPTPNGGLFVSTDSGADFSGAGSLGTFGSSSGGGDFIYAVAIDPQNSQLVYAAASSGVFKSTDGGATWTAINSGLTLFPIDTLTINPQNHDQIFAGELGGGLFVANFGSISVTPGLAVSQSGWWWNPAEPGRGYALEATAGGNLRIAILGYDSSGQSHWYVSQGPLNSDGSYVGTLQDMSFGSPIGLSYRAPAIASAGQIAASFSSATTGQVVLPSGTVEPIQRYQFATNGLAAGPGNAVPQTGWWSIAGQSADGFFLESQAGSIDIAALDFAPDGGPGWYIATGAMNSLSSFAGTWIQLIGGPTLSGSYRAPVTLPGGISASVQFSSPTAGTLNFGGSVIQIRRLAF